MGTKRSKGSLVRFAPLAVVLLACSAPVGPDADDAGDDAPSASEASTDATADAPHACTKK